MNCTRARVTIGEGESEHMTCICGIVKGGTVWLGGDSAATNGGNLDRTIINDHKVFVRENVAFGVCGSPKVMDAIAHVLELPVHQPNVSNRAYLVGELAPAMTNVLKKLDCVVVDPSYGTCFNGAMLIGYNGALYQMEGNFQLIQAARGYDSVGSGSPAALGSLRSTRGWSNPRKRILEALKVSSEENAGVAPPFNVVHVKSITS